MTNGHPRDTVNPGEIICFAGHQILVRAVNFLRDPRHPEAVAQGEVEYAPKDYAAGDHVPTPHGLIQIVA